ncbi:MAG: Gfo/Idh/MocA family oxidoreductase [Pirellulaceae bacterium]|jgi:predicted dehydrogenase|nr:Gfo/Idh/MocA family oxidoreductase [Pirellulaceae bacterium]
MTSASVRWGIMGTARIAAKLATAIHAAEGAQLAAVASRDLARAEQWTNQHRAGAALGDYRALLSDDTIDAIYIPLPPSMHAEWTIRCAEHGKHVLCEKPLGVSSREAEEMAAACAANDVQLMDATMWVHHPRTAAMSASLAELGKLRRATSAFGLNLDSYLKFKPSHLAIAESNLQRAVAHELRLNRSLGGGALLDLGWYCVRATMFAFPGLPQRVFATRRLRGDVDFNLSALLWYSDDRIASFDCGYDLSQRKWFEVVGESGSLVCDDFVNPWEGKATRYWIHGEAGSVREQPCESAEQEVLMVEEFCRLVTAGERDERWPRAAVINQTICEAIDQSAQTESIVEI